MENKKVESESMSEAEDSHTIVLDDVYDIDWLLSGSFLISDLDTCELCDCSANI